MTSNTPATQAYNFTHMFDQPDLRTCSSNKKPVYSQNSMMSIIDKHPDFTKFKYMIQLSDFQEIFDDSQTNFTVFIPSDDTLQKIGKNVFTNMDRTTARSIINASILNHRIPSEILADSPASYFATRHKYDRLFITNINGRTYLNNCVNVIHKDWIASNGIIHVIDGLIVPALT